VGRFLLASVLLLGLALPASAHAGCQRRGERVKARDAEAVVLFTPRHKTSYEMIGCLRAGGRRVVLAHLYGSKHGGRRAVLPLRLDGTIVSWGWTEGDRYGINDVGVATRDLRTGRRREISLAGDGQIPLAVVGGPGGALAWTSYVGVYVADGPRPVRVDRGPADAFSDLAIDGPDVTWNHAGVAHRAPLVPQLTGCALTSDLYAVTSTPDAVLAFRNSGIGSTNRAEAVGCLRSGPDGFVAIGQFAARIAGTVAAAAQNDGDTLTIVAVDLTSHARIGSPVVIDRFAKWDLAADGTIVVAQGHDLVAHTPDGGAVTLTSSPPGALVIVDDATRTVSWGPVRVPLPA
jgi:hypothetical protein